MVTHLVVVNLTPPLIIPVLVQCAQGQSNHWGKNGIFA